MQEIMNICLRGCLHGLTGSMISHISIAPGFKLQPGYVRRVFHLSFYLITFVGRPAHKTAAFTWTSVSGLVSLLAHLNHLLLWGLSPFWMLPLNWMLQAYNLILRNFQSFLRIEPIKLMPNEMYLTANPAATDWYLLVLYFLKSLPHQILSISTMLGYNCLKRHLGFCSFL